jgi:hypothetical protein
MFGGLLEAGDASSTPKAAQVSVVRRNATINNPILAIETGINNVLIIQTSKDIPIPKSAPAIISPIIIVS